MDNRSLLNEVKEISEKLRQWQNEYYVLARPSVSDAEYDKFFDRLVEIEAENPDLIFPDSPTQRVGSDLSHELPESRHTIPVLSLDKAYSVGELLDWLHKLKNREAVEELSIVVEEKIDGISIVLYYEEGLLVRAVTRGNGEVGNDVTANVKTIGSVPLRLSEPITVAVRGEIYLPLKHFESLNSTQEIPYANPRNLAAGTIRRKKSSETALVPLQIFVYEGFFSNQTELFSFGTHHQVLEQLRKLGFRLNPHTHWFSLQAKSGFQSIDSLESYVNKMTEQRSQLPYEIDGLVIKVNEIPIREKVGYTGHHPRWAIAYKFESPTGESVVKAIDIQVGRTGRITPVARITPVEISGSVVSNVTLHNQDYIDSLELSVGDTISVSKRGDVIPAVESVIEKGENGTTWRMPTKCPSCYEILEPEGAHLFCSNVDCPSQKLARILFFVGRSQMDIDGLGGETVDFLFQNNLISSIDELYSFDYSKLVQYDGFGLKKVELIEKGLEKSKAQPFIKVLASLGLKDLGPKVSELLIEAGYSSIKKLFEIADNEDSHLFEEIRGIGPITASGIVKSLKERQNRQLIENLQKAGLKFEAEEKRVSNSPLIFKGQSWCVTGSFEHFKPRDKAKEEIKNQGGKIVSAVSGLTTHLLAGEKAGSKLEKARSLGVQIVLEVEFLKILGR